MEEVLLFAQPKMKQKMSPSQKPNTTRSISLPSRPHPNVYRIEAELKKLKTWGMWSTTPSDHTENLSSLVVLYKCVDELLNLPMTQQAFSRYDRNQKWIDGMLDESVRVLDICGGTREMVSKIKEHVRDLQCALRRRKGDSSIESSIGKFISFRKKIKKEAKGLVASLIKRVVADDSTLVTDLDHHLVVVIKLVTEVSEMSILALQSLFMFFSIKPKPSRWSNVLNLMHKGRVACEEQNGDDVNELENLDAALLSVCKYGSSNKGDAIKIQIAQKRMEAMEACIESIENGLDCLFRQLIRTRALLLNNLSQ